jgi:phosphoglycerol transferase MdoB-like AlkP superfamily enzyme
MADARRFKGRDWLALAAALFVLNSGLTMQNIWPTAWVRLRPEVSVELAVLVLALVAWTVFVRPIGRLAWVLLTALVLALVVGRYAEVTAPALYGRPVNLYWDAEHLPKVGAMLAEVAPVWLVALVGLGAVALLAALVAAIAWCLGRIVRGLRARPARLVLGVLSATVVVLYAASSVFQGQLGYYFSLPVSAGYLRQAQFVLAARAAEHSRALPDAPLPPSDFGRLDGDNVLLMFLESYGAVTYDTPAIARVVAPARDELAHAAAETGQHVVSAFFTSPTFGGASWLAHASFMSGLTVSDTGDYMLLLTQQRETLPKLFDAAGYRTIAVMPGMRNEWPEGAYYGFDAIHGERELAYDGPDFGWWRIPDQFSLASVAAIEARDDSHEPLFTFLPTINTHIPFLPVPPYQADWARVLSVDPFDPDAVEASLARTPDWEALGGPYAESFAYTFTYLAGYLRERSGTDEILVLIGDHQPAASVAGLGARWDVPVHVVTRRDDIAAELVAAGFVDGVALAPRQRSLGDLSDLLLLLLRTFDSPD